MNFRIFPNIKSIKMNAAEFFCTINLANIIAGYATAASLLLPLGYSATQSQVITLPYRIFSLLIAVLCTIIGLMGQRGYPKFTKTLMLFFLCFALCIFRVFVDLASDQTGYARTMSFQVWGFVILSLFSATSVFYSYRYIRFDIAVVLVLLMYLFVMSLRPLGIGLTTADLIMDNTGQRVTGSTALFSIAYGYVGTVSAVLCVYVLFSLNFSLLFKIIAIGLIPLSMYTVFASGSRSPFFTLVLVLMIYFSTRSRNYVFELFILFVLFGFIYLMKDSLLDLLSSVAPVLTSRTDAMLEAGFVSGRDNLAIMGFKEALSNPILGSSTINWKTGVDTFIGYHSAIVDAFAYLGLIGGSFVIALFVITGYYAIFILRNRDSIKYYWVAIIFFVYYIHALAAGGLFHINPAFSAFIVFSIVMYNECITKIRRL